MDSGQGRRHEFAICMGTKEGSVVRKSPSEVQGQSPGRGLETKPPEAGDKC